MYKNYEKENKIKSLKDLTLSREELDEPNQRRRKRAKAHADSIKEINQLKPVRTLRNKSTFPIHAMVMKFKKLVQLTSMKSRHSNKLS